MQVSGWEAENREKGMLTVGVGAGDDAAHAHLGNALQEAVGDEAVGLGDCVQLAQDGEDAVVDAGDNLADASADAGLVAQLGDVLTGLANDDACFLRGDDGSQGELGEGVLVVGARGSVVGAEVAQRLGDIVERGVVGRNQVLLGRHVG